MRILFATGNPHKVVEAVKMLSPLGHSVEPLLVDGETPDFVEPQAEGLEAVAFAKIEQARMMMQGTELEGSAIMVEDSGLFIDSLDGFPGAYSSFVEGTVGLDGILRLLEDAGDRGAEYRAVAIVDSEGRTWQANGICRGRISKEMLGSGGFGYDPIFVPAEGDGRTCAQMSAEEKSAISHRGQALRGLSEVLSSASR